MFEVEINWNGEWVLLGCFASRDDAHWACAKWRQQFGRATEEGDPFRVVEQQQRSAA